MVSRERNTETDYARALLDQLITSVTNKEMKAADAVRKVWQDYIDGKITFEERKTCLDKLGVFDEQLANDGTSRQKIASEQKLPGEQRFRKARL